MKPVNKHLIALVNYIALVPLVYFIPKAVTPYLPENAFVQVCIIVGIIVPVISYIVMPITMKHLSNVSQKVVNKKGTN